MTLRTELEAVLEAIRDGLELEGGAIDLVAVEEGVARVRVHLPDSDDPVLVMGLLIGIQRSVRATVAGIHAVVSQDLLDAGYPLEHLVRQMRRMGDGGREGCM
jgi:hypothetical protein